MRIDEELRRGLKQAGDQARFDPERWQPLLRTEGRGPWRDLPQARRALVAAVLGAVLLAAVAVPLALLAPLGGEDGVRPAARRTEGYGLAISVPRGWDARIEGARPGDAPFPPYVHVANFELPRADTEVASEARAGMAPGDVVIVLLGYRGGADFPQADLPIRVEAGDFVASDGDDRYAASEDFSVGHRRFELLVELRGQVPSQGLLREVNFVLASLEFRVNGEAGYRTHTDVDHGISITVPDPWTFREDPSGPDEPKTVFGVGSWPFTAGGDCAPTAAHESLPADGAFLWLIEHGDSGTPSDFPPRPENFRLQEDTLAQYECSLVPSYLIRWSEGGRLFQAHVAFGPEASESLEAEVLRALDSIEVGGPPAGYQTHTDEGDGLAVTIPERWHFSEEPTDPIEPENILAIGSWPFPDGGVCAPFNALDELPKDGAFAWLIEYHGTDRPEEFVPRPDVFDLDAFRFGVTSCEGTPMYQLRFQGEEGRFLQLQVAFGPDASDSTKADMMDALNTLRTTGVCDVEQTGYLPEVTPSSAAVGSDSTVSGAFPHGETNKEGYAPQAESEWVEAWWNLDPERWPSALPGGEDPIAAEPGPVLKLGEVDVTDMCTYSVSFRVPEVDPGVYPVVVLQVDPESAAAFQPAFVEVTG